MAAEYKITVDMDETTGGDMVIVETVFILVSRLHNGALFSGN